MLHPPASLSVLNCSLHEAVGAQVEDEQRLELSGCSPGCLMTAPPCGLQVEEQKRRAEADKLAAITALEQRSREFMIEKEEKRRLEQRISSMQSQLLIGGHKIEDMPVFRWVVAKGCCQSRRDGTVLRSSVGSRQMSRGGAWLQHICSMHSLVAQHHGHARRQD